MEASRVERPGYVDVSRLASGEFVGMAAAGVLLGSLGIAAGGFLRQTVGERARKPPGTL